MKLIRLLKADLDDRGIAREDYDMQFSLKDWSLNIIGETDLAFNTCLALLEEAGCYCKTLTAAQSQVFFAALPLEENAVSEAYCSLQ